MSIATIDIITFWVWMGKWPVWLAWEMYLLKRRGEKVMVRTISQVAMKRAWMLSCVVYTDLYLLSHFIWTVPEEVSHPHLKGFIGWVLVPILAFWDYKCWHIPRQDYPVWMRWARWPHWYVLLGVLNGHLLFPQVGPTPWNWYNVSW